MRVQKATASVNRLNDLHKFQLAEPRRHVGFDEKRVSSGFVKRSSNTERHRERERERGMSERLGGVQRGGNR